MDINNNKENEINNDYKNDNIAEITIEIKGFFEKDVVINEAKRYDLTLKNTSFHDFSLIVSSLKKINKKDFNKDILINNLSIKNDRIARRYLQQNCLILSFDYAYLNENLSLLDNIKVVSLLFTGFDLSQASLSSFGLKELENEKLKNLTEEQKKLYVLSYCVACPEIIWIVDEKLLQDLSKESIELFDNAVKIRTKHGGVVLVINDKKKSKNK